MKALLLRDLRLALRAGGGFGLGLAFFLIVTMLVPFSVGPEGALLKAIAPGVLWLGALLACLLSLDRLLALDLEDGSLELLLTAPLPRGRAARGDGAGCQHTALDARRADAGRGGLDAICRSGGASDGVAMTPRICALSTTHPRDR